MLVIVLNEANLNHYMLDTGWLYGYILNTCLMFQYFATLYGFYGKIGGIIDLFLSSL